MQVQRIGYGIRGFYRAAHLGHLWEMTPKDAQQRLRILHFWERHGLAATIDAFGVSKRTLYRWRQAGGNPAALAANSCRPRQLRYSRHDPRLVQGIRHLRRLYPNLGKAKLQVLLEPWCREHGLHLPSVSTIGRIIAAAVDKMRHSPARIDRRGRPKPVRRHPKPRKPRGARTAPLQCLAVDNVGRVRDGLRRYILTCIDPASTFGLAVALPGKAAFHTQAALAAILPLLPAKHQVVPSDNVLRNVFKNRPLPLADDLGGQDNGP